MTNESGFFPENTLHVSATLEVETRSKVAQFCCYTKIDSHQSDSISAHMFRDVCDNKRMKKISSARKSLTFDHES